MRTILFTALLFLLASSAAYPWGSQGHAAIGLVAERRLTPEARRHIESILGNDDLAWTLAYQGPHRLAHLGRHVLFVMDKKPLANGRVKLFFI